MPLRTLDLFQKLTRQLLLEFGAFRIEVMVSDWAIRPAHRIALALEFCCWLFGEPTSYCLLLIAQQSAATPLSLPPTGL
jgi:hypothetical protein